MLSAIPQIARCMRHQETPPLNGWMGTKVDFHGPNLLVFSAKASIGQPALMLKWDGELLPGKRLRAD